MGAVPSIACAGRPQPACALALHADRDLFITSRERKRPVSWVRTPLRWHGMAIADAPGESSAHMLEHDMAIRTSAMHRLVAARNALPSSRLRLPYAPTSRIFRATPDLTR